MSSSTPRSRKTERFQGRKPAAAAASELTAPFLLGLLQTAGKPLRLEELATLIGRGRHRKKILNILAVLLEQGQAVYLPGGRYAPPSFLKQIEGRLSVQRGGMGFVSCSSLSLRGRDIYISPGYLGMAWDGDIVRVGLLPDRRGKSPEGIVLEVLERQHTSLLVRVIRSDLSGQLLSGDAAARPLDSRIDRLIMVDTSSLPQPPQVGDILNTAPTVHLDKGLWRAKALLNLGRGENVSAQEAIVKLTHTIPADFPEKVRNEISALPPEPAAGEAPQFGRKDWRHLDFVTIDGSRARDFDDAVYVERLNNGFTLYVAIADVTHYVPEGSGLDREARLRGNSFYFARSVEPMLPPALSNHLCSLRPGRDRLTAGIKMYFSSQGIETAPPEFCFSIICSRARLTYNLVFQALENKNPIDRALLGSLLPMLENARLLAQALQEHRRERGALFLDLPETEVQINSEDKVENIHIAPHHFAHQMIEEFMVAANEAVAAFLTRKREIFPYRIHPHPDQEKLTGLFRTLTRSGLARISPPNGLEAISRLLNEIKAGKKSASSAGQADRMAPQPGAQRQAPDAGESSAHDQGKAYAISNLVLRAMMQARYAPRLEGHFGLASSCYCHFTSPIRRYADVLVHRALRRALDAGVPDAAGVKPAHRQLDRILESVNAAENQSKEAEMELNRRLGVLFMLDKIGCEFNGRISGLNEFGIFIQLEHNLTEGVIRLTSLNDHFAYLPDRQELAGRFSGRRFSLGQELRAKLVEAHLDNLELTFELVN
ncbi:MAG: RNB domain-containing ribonuclease [Desulfovibrionaceae bacterium]|nr:RNB domain-containing ribonuclease [Desulfovibrionaceae bacterium]